MAQEETKKKIQNYEMEEITISDELRKQYEQATGEIEYNMTNDFMFRAILQRNHKVLKGLCTSLLHLNSKEITSIQILNPINLGEARDDKDFILDIQIEIDHKQLLDLEMQVINYADWPERSLSYLCRMYDQLSSGEDYKNVKQTQFIGIIDFDLFPKYPELYAHYKLVNVGKKHKNIYTDKFIMSVLNLRHIKEATETDREYKIDYWSKLFQVKTWEDLRMIAQKDKNIKEASESLYVMNQDEIVRQQCRAREDAIRRENAMKKKIEELSAQLEEKDLQIEKERSKERNNAIQALMHNLKCTREEAKKYLQITEE